MSEATEEREQESSHGDGLHTARRAATGALVAGLVGGLAGAAKVLRDRHAAQEREQGERDERENHEDDRREPESSAVEVEPGDETAGEEEPEREDTDEAAQPEPDDEADAESPADRRQDDDEADDEHGDDESQPRGGAAEAVDSARRQLERLLGSEPESVSGVERDENGWKVTLEVVEVRRIPDSTDVLSSYEVVLDESNEMVRLNRARRYRRGQVEDGGE